MIRHLILLSADDHGQAAIRAAAGSLDDVAAIDGIEAVGLHHDTSGKSQGYDLLLSLDLANAQALEAWNAHPVHDAVVGAIKAAGAKVLVFDYET